MSLMKLWFHWYRGYYIFSMVAFRAVALQEV